MRTLADIVICSNAVFTGTEDYPKPAAIVIKDNKIVRVADQNFSEAYIDDNTKVYDFGNRLVMPGFHDFHIHLLLGSMLKDAVKLYEAKSAEEVAHLLRNYADEHPEEKILYGCGWDYNMWDKPGTVHRKYLDTAVTDRPVILYHAELHSVWVNSKALEMAGITSQTKNPEFGEIMKDECGQPTGYLLEHAVGLITRALPMDMETKRKLLETFLLEAARYGVTSIHDLLRIPEMYTEEAELYSTYEKEGKLTARIHFVAPLNGDLQEARRLRNQYHSNMVQFAGFKQFIDGVITSRTAYLLEPYASGEPTKGNTVFTGEKIKKWTADADRENFRVRFHCIGDGAVRLALDAFEEAFAVNGKRDARHAIEHVEMIDTLDIKRFKELGVLASIQPEHINGSSIGIFEDLIGKDRMNNYMLQKTLQDAGAKLVFGSDFPVVGLNPLSGIYRAVTRFDDTGTVWNGKERITLSQALSAYTFGPAYGSFREGELGTIEEGKLADIIALDCNLFTINSEEIKQAKVVFTMVDGKVVYEGI